MADRSRLAIVTGTSTGLGAALRDALLRRGWNVLGMSRRDVAHDDPRYEHLALDLTDLAALERACREVLAPRIESPTWARVGLVNNAATVGMMRPMEDAGGSELAGVFAANVIAPMLLMGLVMRSTPRGTPLRVINVSTGAALRGLPGNSDYSASKAALRLASMAMAAELSSEERPGGPRPDSAVLSYAPGVVDTEMQVAARSSTNPWKGLFVGFHEKGMLVPPEAPVGEMVDFLEGDGHEPFTEKRFEPS